MRKAFVLFQLVSHDCLLLSLVDTSSARDALNLKIVCKTNEHKNKLIYSTIFNQPNTFAQPSISLFDKTEIWDTWSCTYLVDCRIDGKTFIADAWFTFLVVVPVVLAITFLANVACMMPWIVCHDFSSLFCSSPLFRSKCALLILGR